MMEKKASFVLLGGSLSSSELEIVLDEKMKSVCAWKSAPIFTAASISAYIMTFSLQNKSTRKVLLLS